MLTKPPHEILAMGKDLERYLQEKALGKGGRRRGSFLTYLA